MDAWIYSVGSLTGDEGDPSSHIASKMLAVIGFESPDAFNSELSKYKRGALPPDLQQRIINIFETGEQSANQESVDIIRISDGIVEALDDSLEIKSPFRVCAGVPPAAISVYSMSFEPAGENTAINVRLGVSIEKYALPREESLQEICSIIINKIVPVSDESLFNKWADLGVDSEYDEYLDEWLSDARISIRSWLESEGADGALAENNEFLTELGQQMLYLTEGIGLTTKTFVDEDGTEHCFWIEGDEESGLEDD
jgi:hypothetical protein